jgi:hypothetical protein
VSVAEQVLVSGGVALVVAVISAVTTFKAQENQLRTQLRTEFMAEAAIRRLLLRPEWRRRSFEQIARRLHGFSEDQLRQYLIRAGALCFPDEDGTEYWGLIERNEKSV